MGNKGKLVNVLQSDYSISQDSLFKVDVEIQLVIYLREMSTSANLAVNVLLDWTTYRPSNTSEVNTRRAIDVGFISLATTGQRTADIYTKGAIFKESSYYTYIRTKAREDLPKPRDETQCEETKASLSLAKLGSFSTATK